MVMIILFNSISVVSQAMEAKTILPQQFIANRLQSLVQVANNVAKNSSFLRTKKYRFPQSSLLRKDRAIKKQTSKFRSVAGMTLSALAFQITPATAQCDSSSCTAAYCDAASFGVINAMADQWPVPAGSTVSIPQELTDSTAASYCGEVSYTYQTTYTDPATGSDVTINSGTNDGLPSFVTFGSNQLNPPESDRWYSNSYTSNFEDSMLDGSNYWGLPSSTANDQEFMVIDAGENLLISGVLAQSGYYDECTDKIRVEYSLDSSCWSSPESCGLWTQVDGGAQFVTNTPCERERYSQIEEIEFSSIILARYVKIIISEYSSSYPGFRAGLLQTANEVTISPSNLSHVTDYSVTATKTLVYDARVTGASSSTRVETQDFDITISPNCDVLTYKTPASNQMDVDVGQSITYAPNYSFLYNDAETESGIEWSSVCGVPVITYTNLDSAFMTYDAASQGLTVSPTLLSQVGQHVVDRTQSSPYLVDDDVTQVTFDVFCQDDGWQAQTETDITVTVTESNTFTPVLLSSPLGCKTASFTYENLTSAGSSDTSQPSFITLDSSSGTITIAPTDSSSVLNSPYTFQLSLNDPNGVISDQLSDVITLNVQITEAICDQSAFSTISDATVASFPNSDAVTHSVLPELAETMQNSLCGIVAFSYETSFTNPLTQVSETIASTTNNGLPSFAQLEHNFVNPDNSSRQTSSSWASYHEDCMLDGNSFWIPSPNAVEPDLIIDAGQNIQISGIVVQGRSDCCWERTLISVKLAYSYDGTQFYDAQSGEALDAQNCCADASDQKQILLTDSITARYLKITLFEWQGTEWWGGRFALISSPNQMTIAPTFISQATDYTVTATKTLVFDDRVIRSTSSDREEEQTFQITVQENCQALSFGTVTVADITVEIASSQTLTPTSSYQFDYGSGAQDTDEEGTAWSSSSCGIPQIGFTGIITAFMTENSADQTLSINPTQGSQIGDYPISVSQTSTYGHTDVPTDVTVTVICADTSWQTQTLTSLTALIDETLTFTPEIASLPIGCLTGTISYENISQNGSSITQLPSFITSDPSTGELTIIATTADEMQNSPYTFDLVLTDSSGTIANPASTTISLDVMISEAKCNLATFAQISTPVVFELPDNTAATVDISSQLQEEPQATLCGTTSLVVAGLPSFVTSVQATVSDSANLSILPTNLSQIAIHDITVTHTLVYDQNVQRTTSGDRVEQQTLQVTVQINCWNLSFGQLTLSDISVEVNSSATLSPAPFYEFDFGSGLQDTDQESVSWSTSSCGVPDISFSGIDATFMTEDAVLKTLAIDPTLGSQVNTYPIVVTQSSSYHTSEDTNVVVDVSCPDTAWQTQTETSITALLDQTYTFTPLITSSPIGCKTATVNYDSMTENGLSIGQFPSFISDSVTGELTIYPTDAAEIQNSPYQFTLNLIDNLGIISTQSTEIQLEVKIAQATCDAANFSTLNDVSISFPSSTLTRIEISKEFTQSLQQELCGTTSITFSTTYPDFETGTSQTIDSASNGGLPSLALPVNVLNLAEESRSYSSVLNNSAIGTGFARSMLDSDQGWCSEGPANIDEWMVIDAGEEVQVKGLVVQGRKKYDDFIRYMKSCQIATSSDNIEWTDIQSGQEFFTGIQGNNMDQKHDIILESIVTARYVKLKPLTWETRICIRVGLLLAIDHDETIDASVLFEPTFISHVNDYTVSVIRTLVYDENVLRTDTGDRVDTLDFQLTVSADCSLLSFSEIELEKDSVNLGQTLVLTPAAFYQYDFGDGLESLDTEGTEWQTVCGVPTIDLSGFESSFMIYNPVDYSLLISPTEMTQINDYDISANLSSNFASENRVFTLTVNKLVVYTTLILDETLTAEPISIQTGAENVVELLYTIETQEPILNQELTFEMQLAGETLTEWISVEQSKEKIVIDPSLIDLEAGIFTIDVVCTAVYTNNSILDLIFSNSLEGNTLVIEESFQIEVFTDQNGPYFLGNLEDQGKNIGEFWSYELPDAIDPNASSIKISYSVSPSASFIYGVLGTDLSLESLYVDSVDQDEEAGMYAIVITLEALEDGRKTTVAFMLSITGEDEEEQGFAGVVIEELEEESESLEEEQVEEFNFNPELPAPTVKLQKISRIGNLRLIFDQNMIFGSTLPNQNDIRLIMQTQYGDFVGKFYATEQSNQQKRLLQEENDLFSWTVKNMTDTQLDIDLSFESPLEVSQGTYSDKLQIAFLSDSFVSKQSGKLLQLDTSSQAHLDFNIPRQFPSAEEAQRVENIADSATSFANANLVFFIIGQLAAGQLIKKIIPLFLTIQLVFFLVMSLPYFPLNTTFITDALDDAIKLGALKRLISEKVEESTDGVKESLADQTGLIVLIGVPLVILMTILAILAAVYCKKRPKFQQFGIKLKDKLVFGMIINISIVSFLAFAQQASFGRYLNFNEERPPSNIVMVLFVIALLAFTLLFTELADLLSLEDKQFETTYGVLYTKYRTRNHMARMFLFFFFCHRIGYVFVLNMTVPFSVTYNGLMAVQLLWLIYLILYDPYLDPLETKKEIMNSYLLLLFLYCIPSYTDQVPDPELRYTFGFISISLLGMLVLSNLVITIIQIVKEKIKKNAYKAIVAGKLRKIECRKIEEKYIIPREPSQVSESSEEEKVPETIIEKAHKLEIQMLNQIQEIDRVLDLNEIQEVENYLESDKSSEICAFDYIPSVRGDDVTPSPVKYKQKRLIYEPQFTQDEAQIIHQKNKDQLLAEMMAVKVTTRQVVNVPTPKPPISEAQKEADFQKRLDFFERKMVANKVRANIINERQKQRQVSDSSEEY